MLPTRNRVQAKKILHTPQSVVLSAEPVLTTRAGGGGRNRGAPDAGPAATPDAGPTARSKLAGGPGGGGLLEPLRKAAPREEPAPAESLPAGASEQYTYVTDDSGYAWLYDTASAQYYYYDASQGTYIPYGAADAQAAATPSDAAEPAAREEVRGGSSSKQYQRKRRIVRMAGGQVWEDASLDDWPTDDYRLFAGDLGPDVTGEMLEQAFGKFRSLQRSLVVRDKGTGKSKGYGFLSFGDADDFLAAWKEFNGKYVGSRPIKLRKSTWRDRNVDIRKVKRQDKRAFLDYKQGKR